MLAAPWPGVYTGTSSSPAPSARVRREQPLEGSLGERVAEDRALDLVAAHLLEDGQLRSGLHALGDDTVAKAVGHVDDLLDDGRVTGLPSDARDEGGVDLQPADGE